VHDRPHHLAQRRLTYLLRRALGDLFLGTYDVTRSSILCDGLSPNHRTQGEATHAPWGATT
jgi:hypothetical protein